MTNDETTESPACRRSFKKTIPPAAHFGARPGKRLSPRVERSEGGHGDFLPKAAGISAGGGEWPRGAIVYRPPGRHAGHRIKRSGTLLRRPFDDGCDICDARAGRVRDSRSLPDERGRRR